MNKILFVITVCCLLLAPTFSSAVVQYHTKQKIEPASVTYRLSDEELKEALVYWLKSKGLDVDGTISVYTPSGYRTSNESAANVTVTKE